MKNHRQKRIAVISVCICLLAAAAALAFFLQGRQKPDTAPEKAGSETAPFPYEKELGELLGAYTVYESAPGVWTAEYTDGNAMTRNLTIEEERPLFEQVTEQFCQIYGNEYEKAVQSMLEAEGYTDVAVSLEILFPPMTEEELQKQKTVFREQQAAAAIRKESFFAYYAAYMEIEVEGTANKFDVFRDVSAYLAGKTGGSGAFHFAMGQGNERISRYVIGREMVEENNFWWKVVSSSPVMTWIDPAVRAEIQHVFYNGNGLQPVNAGEEGTLCFYLDGRFVNVSVPDPAEEFLFRSGLPGEDRFYILGTNPQQAMTPDGTAGAEESGPCRLLACSFSGEILWDTAIIPKPGEYFVDMAADAMGNLYLASRNQYPSDLDGAQLYAYNSDGELLFELWDEQMEANMIDGLVGGEDGVYFTTWTEVSDGALEKSAVYAVYMKYNGTMQWKKTLDGTGITKADGITFENGYLTYYTDHKTGTGRCYLLNAEGEITRVIQAPAYMQLYGGDEREETLFFDSGMNTSMRIYDLNGVYRKEMTNSDYTIQGVVIHQDDLYFVRRTRANGYTDGGGQEKGKVDRFDRSSLNWQSVTEFVPLEKKSYLADDAQMTRFFPANPGGGADEYAAEELAEYGAVVRRTWTEGVPASAYDTAASTVTMEWDGRSVVLGYSLFDQYVYDIDRDGLTEYVYIEENGADAPCFTVRYFDFSSGETHVLREENEWVMFARTENGMLALFSAESAWAPGDGGLTLHCTGEWKGDLTVTEGGV